MVAEGYVPTLVTHQSLDNGQTKPSICALASHKEGLGHIRY